MRTAICTISTRDHVFKADALFHSLRGNTDADLINLIIDHEPDSDTDTHGVMLRGRASLSVKWKEEIFGKYRGDELRWGSKPLLIGQLLQEGYDKVMYVDNDIFFYSSPDFLFKLLDVHTVLLTPHLYSADPTGEQHWLEANFRVGLYNAGFVAVGQCGRKSMEWWAGCCAYNVRKSSWRGLFDDQKYLDLLPVLFDDVHVLKHKGCNVAGWNTDLCPRSTDDDGNVIIDGKWPLVFVHYNTFTLRMAHLGKDPGMAILAQKYVSLLGAHAQELSLSQLARYSFADTTDIIRHVFWKLQRALTG